MNDTDLPLTFREAALADVPRVVALLADDVVGREDHAHDDWTPEAAFAAMGPGNTFIVAEHGDTIVGCYQFTLIPSLSPRIPLRAQIESVRIDAPLRGQGLGTALMRDAEARARAAGAVLMQLTSNAARGRAHSFYGELGYEPSHVGFKRWLI